MLYFYIKKYQTRANDSRLTFTPGVLGHHYLLNYWHLKNADFFIIFLILKKQSTNNIMHKLLSIIIL